MIRIRLAEDRDCNQVYVYFTFLFSRKASYCRRVYKKLFNTISLPNILKNEEELRQMWSSPITRNELLKLEDNGFTKQDLKSIQSLIDAEESDIYDVLEHIAYNKNPILRTTRVANSEEKIHSNLDDNQKEFIDFVLTKYVEGGVDELDINRLSKLLELKYKSVHDGQKALGDAESIKNTFIDFQKYLY